MQENYNWQLKDDEPERARIISSELNISFTLARLLVQRGIDNSDEGRKFLFGGLDDLSDPFSLGGMRRAVERIEQGMDKQEKIVIYGDYDVDGVCSTALLKQCLQRLGTDADYYVPDRYYEGYGLNLPAVEALAGKGCKLLITVDSGISSIDEVKMAGELGMDVIITDHHTPPAQLPPAVAIVNPRLDMHRETRDLAGAGVAFKLCQALSRDKLGTEEIREWIGLAALATIADVVSLTGENRLLVKYGLKQLSAGNNEGIKALMSATGLEGRELSPWQVGFVLAPRINAAGRLATADLSIELLLSRDPAVCGELAARLCGLNNERRVMEDMILKEALLQIENGEKEDFLVLAAEGWHPGVTGIVASRLCERYQRPVLLISWEGEKGRGSCRSLPGMDVYQALAGHSDLMLRFGGHRMAAGLSLPRENFALLKAGLNQWITHLDSAVSGPPPRLADLELEASDVKMELVQEIQSLEPFGEGNPAPVFVMRALEIRNPRLIGKNKEHFLCQATNVNAVAFNRSDFLGSNLECCRQDILFELEENEYQGQKSLRLKLKDMKPSHIADNSRHSACSPTWLHQLLKNICGEMEQGNPVLLIYPTWRSLTRHQAMLEGCFRPGVVRVLHGRVPLRERRYIENALAGGSQGLFLSTSAYCRYYLRNRAFPPGMRYKMALGPVSGDDEWGSLMDRHGILYGETSFHNPGFTVREWQRESGGHIMVYTNRPATIQRFSRRMPDIYVEAGINCWQERRKIRRRFLDADHGILLSDGMLSFTMPPDQVRELVFADMPYSVYEAMMVLDQVAASQDLPVYAMFDRKDMDFNRAFLEKSYPPSELVKKVWTYFRARGENPLELTAEELIRTLARELDQDFRPGQLAGVLAVLTDLGLCSLHKKGSIMAIKFLPVAAKAANVSNSPYYLEGQAEKLAFKDWLQAINMNCSW